jgi:adenosylcobyric acid synthase
MFEKEKATHQVQAVASHARGLLNGSGEASLSGYEIHMGRSQTDSDLFPPFQITQRSGRAVSSPDGASDEDGLTLGTYMHGLFHNDALRRSVLACAARIKGVELSQSSDGVNYDREFDKLAEQFRRELDMDLVYRAAGLRA